MQPTSGINCSLAICFALLEPTPTGTCPRSPLEEQICVLPELPTRLPLGRERLDILLLRFRDDGEHVLRPALDQWHKRAMSKGAVRAAEGKVVGEGRDADGEVGGDAFGRGPDIFEVFAVSAEGEAREPGSVETCGANDDVAVVVVAILVEETVGCEFVDGFGEDGGVGRYERFEVAWSRGWTATAWVEILWDDLVAESGIVVELAGHLVVGEFASIFCFLRSFDDELEALVEFVLDLLPVLEILLRVLFKILELFRRVFKVRTIFTGPRLREPGCDPDWRPHPVIELLDLGLELRHDLHSTAAGTHHCDPLVLQVVSLFIGR